MVHSHENNVMQFRKQKQNTFKGKLCMCVCVLGEGFTSDKIIKFLKKKKVFFLCVCLKCNAS